MKSFRHGIHPYGFKDLSMNESIHEIKPGKELVFPLSQHIGAPAKPIVTVGDKVLSGQVIAEASSFVSSNIISSVSGEVIAIEPRTTLMGETVDSIVIENDTKYDSVATLGKKRKFEKLSREEIISIVQEAGIVGLGGAGFPTHVKLSPKDPSSIDTIIINGAECEPYLTSDYRLMLEKGESLIQGIQIILQLFENAKAVIGIENNKPEAIQSLSKQCENYDRIEVQTLKTKYPQGGERMLIHAITGRDINSKQLPMDANCIVENVATIIAIYEAVSLSTPLIKRVMTITGDAIAKPSNVRVYLGDSYQHVLDKVGGFSKQPEKIISGGPMMGIAMFTLDIPVTKTSASILAYEKDDVAKHQTTSCIHCGRCVNACAEGLIPQMMYKASEATDWVQFEKLHGMECIECGSCAYVCPAKIPLTQSFQYARRTIIKKKKEEQAKSNKEIKK